MIWNDPDRKDRSEVRAEKDEQDAFLYAKVYAEVEAEFRARDRGSNIIGICAETMRRCRIANEEN